MAKSEQLSHPARAATIRRLLPHWLLLLAALAAMSCSHEARAETDDYAMKAGSLYNFLEFTDWPPQAFTALTAPLVIGVLGTDPFGHALEDAVHGKQAKGRPLVIQHFRRVGEIKNCQVLFVSGSETKRLPRILAGLKGRSILTVSDMKDFAAHGGMVRLLAAGDQIQFQINLDVLKTAGLAVSSKLLRVAEIVSSTNK